MEVPSYEKWWHIYVDNDTVMTWIREDDVCAYLEENEQGNWCKFTIYL